MDGRPPQAGATVAPGPARQGRDRLDVTLHTADGVRLSGRWWPADDPLATAVVVHGFSAGQDDPAVVGLATSLERAGFAVLSYDARGHGASGGTCELGSAEHLDVASALGAAAEAGRPVVAVGISMGGVAVCRHLASRAEPGPVGAVLVSAPARWEMRPSPIGVLMALVTRTAPGRWLARRHLGVRVAPRWRTGPALESLVARIPEPLAVVHGTGDRLLGPDHARRLAVRAVGPRRLDLVGGMGHGAGPASRAVVVEVARWVLSVGGRGPTTTPTR